MLRRRRRFAEVLRSTVLVTLTTGRTVGGILIGEYDDAIALTRARVESSDGQLVEADGELLIPLEQIEYAQVGVTLPVSSEAEQRAARPIAARPVRVRSVQAG